MTVHLEPGRFYAGISLPFFVPHSMVTHKLESLGFTNVSFHTRAEQAKLAVDPKKYPGYDDGWSEWIEADYAGPKKDLEFEKHWSWLLVVPHPAPGSKEPPQEPTDPAPTLDLQKPRMIGESALVVGLLVVGFGLLLRRS